MPRKEAHTINLEASSQSISAFHASFAAYSAAEQYCEAKATTSTATSGASSSRLHRDPMPPEPNEYKAIIKHEHAEGFKQAMKVEIESLESKNTWQGVPLTHAINNGKIPIRTR